MSLSFLDNIASRKVETLIEINISLEETGFNEDISGKFYLSRNGYLYNTPSKKVTWLKFLGLSFYLPIRGVVSKCYEVGCRCFGKHIDQKGYQDLDHTFKLCRIAWDAVIGKGDISLLERVDQFALEEIDYNNASRDQEFTLPRHMRFAKGHYIAKCMHPLFHKTDCQSVVRLETRIQNLQKEKEILNKKLKSRNHNQGLLGSMLSALTNESSLYANLTNAQILLLLRQNDRNIARLSEHLSKAQRVKKYAIQAILSQQCCPDLKSTILDSIVENQAEVKCADITCYKQQRICGLLYKIDCCTTRCWALDCLCYMCCFWPDAREACVI